MHGTSESSLHRELAPAVPQWIRHDWSVGQAAGLASAIKASAPKAGNVHPTASFADMRYADFLASATAISSVFDRSATQSLGKLVLSSVQATRAAVDLNTNLGSLLLIAPLAKGLDRWRSASVRPRCGDSKPGCEELRERVHGELENLTPADAKDVYEAIRLANPAGLGRQSQHDIREDPPADLRQAMSQAAALDAVARQYVSDFADVFEAIVRWLIDDLKTGVDILEAVCRAQARWLAREPDGLIARKTGLDVAREVQRMALEVVESMDSASNRSDNAGQTPGPTEAARETMAQSIVHGEEYRALDRFLRADGNRRNPGTTADLLAAGLFVILVSHWS